MKNFGQGLGTCGIWTGFGCAAFGAPEEVSIMAVCAFLATAALWLFGNDSEEKDDEGEESDNG